MVIIIVNLNYHKDISNYNNVIRYSLYYHYQVFNMTHISIYKQMITIMLILIRMNCFIRNGILTR